MTRSELRNIKGLINEVSDGTYAVFDCEPEDMSSWSDSANQAVIGEVLKNKDMDWFGRERLADPSKPFWLGEGNTSPYVQAFDVRERESFEDLYVLYITEKQNDRLAETLKKVDFDGSRVILDMYQDPDNDDWLILTLDAIDMIAYPDGKIYHLKEI